jgi:cell division protease FtsH
VFLGGGSEFSSRPFAEATQAIIDGEVSKLLREAEQRAIGVLRDHRDVLDRVVQLLVANETVDGSQIYALAGRPVPAGAPGVTMAPGGRAAAASATSLAASASSAVGAAGDPRETNDSKTTGETKNQGGPASAVTGPATTNAAAGQGPAVSG